MIIFLYGEDAYRMREKIKEIIERYQKIHKSGLNLKYFADFNDLKDGLRQNSMFKEKKLAIIENLFSKPEFKEKFLREGKNFAESEDVVLIYQEGEIKKNDGLFKFLIKNSRSQEFSLLEGYKLKNWIKNEFKKYNILAGSEVVERLAEYVGNDLWRMSNEIKKLASYRKDIRPDDVRLLVKSKIETDIFETIDAIADKNKKKALELLHRHLEKGDSPLYLLSMMNYQFRNLLIVKDFIEKYKPYNVILKKSGLHPYVVKKSYNLCQRFTLQELKKNLQKIFQIDLDIKTGKIEPRVGLDLLVAEI